MCAGLEITESHCLIGGVWLAGCRPRTVVSPQRGRVCGSIMSIRRRLKSDGACVRRVLRVLALGAVLVCIGCRNGKSPAMEEAHGGGINALGSMSLGQHNPRTSDNVLLYYMFLGSLNRMTSGFVIERQWILLANRTGNAPAFRCNPFSTPVARPAASPRNKSRAKFTCAQTGPPGASRM